MERITYRKTLDVHKNGVQFLLQGFETADKLSRVIEISLMASGDAIDFPLEQIVAMMYVTSPGATEPSINSCTIVDNKIVYEVLPIVVEGITTMQLKLIETSPDGSKSVLTSPKFEVEVTRSGVDDGGAELKASFTAIEEFIGKAESAYGSRLMKIELTSDCLFKAYYADGSEYETDVLQKLFLNGNVLLSESFAHGGTGVRVGEDTDNSKYYSNVSKSEALNAKAIMEDSEEILEEVKLHGVYTAFSVDFETGEVEYVSPSFKFIINKETGELDTVGQSYTFSEEIGRVVNEWLVTNGVNITELQNISTEHSQDIKALEKAVSTNAEEIGNTNENLEALSKRVTPIELGGTGATSIEGALLALGLASVAKIKTGTYVGNGGWTHVDGIPIYSGKVSIPCEKCPRVIILQYGASMAFGIIPEGKQVGTCIEFYTNNYTNHFGFNVSHDGANLTWETNSIYGQYCMNQQGNTYTYLFLY